MMKGRTVALFMLLLLCVAMTAGYFYQQHQGHLHHSVGTTALITQEDHDRFLRSGIHCEESYIVQGHEGPESVLRMYSMTQQEFRQLNPGVGIMAEKGTVLCVRGRFGVKEEHATAFDWFWPVTAAVAAFSGFTLTWLFNKFCRKGRTDKEASSGAQAVPV